jgi:hypothetical protein
VKTAIETLPRVGPGCVLVGDGDVSQMLDRGDRVAAQVYVKGLAPSWGAVLRGVLSDVHVSCFEMLQRST